MQEFQALYREQGEHWATRVAYPEAGPQLLLQACVQSVANAGAWVEHEYATGKLRTDLLVHWPLGDDRERRIAIECRKRRERDSMEYTLEWGLEQTRNYMDRCGTTEGHLIVIESDQSMTWDQYLFRREDTTDGAPVIIWGC